MMRVVWTDSSKKILRYRSENYTIVETHDFIVWLMNKIDNLLSNPILSKRYKEENGAYLGMSRIVVRKFKIYYEKVDDEIIIVAVKFPQKTWYSPSFLGELPQFNVKNLFRLRCIARVVFLCALMRKENMDILSLMLKKSKHKSSLISPLYKRLLKSLFLVHPKCSSKLSK